MESRQPRIQSDPNTGGGLTRRSFWRVQTCCLRLRFCRWRLGCSGGDGPKFRASSEGRFTRCFSIGITVKTTDSPRDALYFPNPGDLQPLCETWEAQGYSASGPAEYP